MAGVLLLFAFSMSLVINAIERRSQSSEKSVTPPVPSTPEDTLR